MFVWGLWVCLFFLSSQRQSLPPKPKQALRVLHAGRLCPLLCAATAPLPVGGEACSYKRGPGWETQPLGPPVSKGRELKGGGPREGRDAEGRHQFSIPQWLQIFTLVFFSPLPSWKGGGTSTLKGKLSRGLRGRILALALPTGVINTRGCYYF